MDTYTPAEAGGMLATARLSPDAATARKRVKNLREAGALRPAGQGPAEHGPESAFRYTGREIAIASLWFLLIDGAGLTYAQAKVLRDLLDLPYGRADHPHGGARPLVDELFRDIQRGGCPTLWLVVWRMPSGKTFHSFHYRLTGEFDAIEYPCSEAEPILRSAVDLASLFEPFLEASLLPREAVH